jgi:hypothetical protein
MLCTKIAGLHLYFSGFFLVFARLKWVITGLGYFCSAFLHPDMLLTRVISWCFAKFLSCPSEHATLVGFLTVNAESDKNPTNYHG